MNQNFFRIKKKKQFSVTLQAPNSRVLNSTETFTQKHSAFTNIKSVMKGFGLKSVFVQDDTVEPIVVNKLLATGKLVPTKLRPKK